MKSRKRYSKSEKRKIIWSISACKKLKDAMMSVGIDIYSDKFSDKKYANKLISKWRKILYVNNEIEDINKECNFLSFTLPQTDTYYAQDETEDKLFDDFMELERKTELRLKRLLKCSRHT